MSSAIEWKPEHSTSCYDYNGIHRISRDVMFLTCTNNSWLLDYGDDTNNTPHIKLRAKTLEEAKIEAEVRHALERN